jgi:hypothetical protein
VPLLAHLPEAEIRRYVAGGRSLQTERHVRVCIFCMHRLAEAAQRTVVWERRGLLGRLVRIDYSEAVDELVAEIEDELRRHAA